MGSFGKHFESTYTGSMFGAGLNVFAVWGYVIANTKPPGLVELNAKSLAATLGTSIEEVNDAIEKLCSADPDSRSEEDEGRRLVKEGQFLYRVPTFEKYRKLRDEDARRAYERERKAEQRRKKKAKIVPKMSRVVPECPAVSAQAEAEAEAEAEADLSLSRNVREETIGRTGFPEKAEVIAYCEKQKWPIESGLSFWLHFDEKRSNGEPIGPNWHWWSRLEKWIMDDHRKTITGNGRKNGGSVTPQPKVYTKF